MRTEFWSEKLKLRDQLEDLEVNGKIILEWILRKHAGKVWRRLIWLKIGGSGGML
jgi:hypothetical protein